MSGLTSSIDDFNDLVQDNKGSLGCQQSLLLQFPIPAYLQTRKFYQRLHSSGICFSASLNLLSTLSKTSQTKVIVSFRSIAFECWQEYTRDVLLLCSYSESSWFCWFLDLIANISSNCVGNFCQWECCNLHDSAHLAFRFVNSSRDFWMDMSAEFIVARNRSKYLGNAYNILLASLPTQSNETNVLCESFTLSLQQIMSSLSSLELRLHQS